MTVTIVVPSKELTEHEKESTLSSLGTARATTQGPTQFSLPNYPV